MTQEPAPNYVLTTDEGVTLAAAMLAREARKHGWRYVIIKGRPATDTGLRTKALSTDVDILPASSDREAVQRFLHGMGWRERPMDDHDNGFPIHGTGYFHPGWPCDIDVHEYIPGCERPTDDVVEALTASGETVPMATEVVPVPDLGGHVVVLATSALRNEVSEVGARQLDELTRRAADLVPGEDVLRSARATGSVAALADFLCRTYPDLDLGEVPAPSRDWVLRTTARSSASIRVVALLEAPWRDKAQVLYRALLPSRAALANKDLKILEIPRRQVWRRRWERLVAALRMLPRIADEVRDYRRARRAG